MYSTVRRIYLPKCCTHLTPIEIISTYAFSLHSHWIMAGVRGRVNKLA